MNPIFLNLKRLITSSLNMLVGLSLFYGITGSAAVYPGGGIVDLKYDRYLLEFDQLTEWIGGQRKHPYVNRPDNANELIKFRNRLAETIKLNFHWVNLGKTGNYLAMNQAILYFAQAANDLYIINIDTHSITGSLELSDYQEFFKAAGRAAAIQDLINEHGEFRTVRNWAADRMKSVNSNFNHWTKLKPPGDITRTDQRSWTQEGYQELMDYWKNSNGPRPETKKPPQNNKPPAVNGARSDPPAGKSVIVIGENGLPIGKQ